MGIMSHLLTPEKSPIWIGCDHGGHELKSHVLAWLAERSILFHDAGCHSTAIVRYPCYAAQVAGAIVRGEAIRGILICSTGIGMSIMASIAGFEPRFATSASMGRMTRAHNDSNVLCLGGKITGVFEALDILEMWLNTAYEAGRHSISLGLIGEAEQAMSGGSVWNPGDPMVTTKDTSDVPVV